MSDNGKAPSEKGEDSMRGALHTETELNVNVAKIELVYSAAFIGRTYAFFKAISGKIDTGEGKAGPSSAGVNEYLQKRTKEELEK